MRILILFLLSVIIFPGEFYAQSNPGGIGDVSTFYDMSLEELMKIEVTVASTKALTTRESPGILTIITEDEIRKSGATDLIELLQKVPGFNFGVDVEGVVGIGVRGNWAHEGKVLMLLDGHELNEDLFSALEMGAHYSIDLIKQIEVIRGPGSASYGGNAEYAVINIISKHAPGGDGIVVNSAYSQMSRQFASRNFSFNISKPIGKTNLSFSSFLSQANRSQDDFTDNFGQSYNMANQSPINTSQYKLDFSWKSLKVSAFADQYHLQQRDGYENVFTQKYPTNFDSYHLLAEYEIRAGKKLTLTPVIKYKYQLPWNFDGISEEDEFTPYNVSVQNILGSLRANYDFSSVVNLISGIEANRQFAKQLLDSVYFGINDREFKTNNFAAFTQLLIKHKIANLTLGARYNYNDRFDAAFVPRVGLTRVFNKWHLKLLYSSAFRSPSIENINSGPGIKPERTTVMELETGYKLGDKSYLTANIFDITTHDAIIFYYDQDNIDAYKNEGMTGTRGVEFEYRVKTASGYMNLNYAYSTTNGKTTNDRYAVPGKKGLLIGFPENKIGLLSNLRLTSKINVSPAFTWVDKRYDVFNDPNTGTEQLKVYKQAIYIDMMFNFEEKIVKGLLIQAGCMNILDDKVVFIQPYNSNHAALPGTSREFRLKVSYNLSFRK